MREGRSHLFRHLWDMQTNEEVQLLRWIWVGSFLSKPETGVPSEPELPSYQAQ